MSKAIIIPLIVFLAHIHLQAQPLPKDTKEGTATISGRVTLKGEPVRGATMALQQNRPPGMPTQDPGERVKTDEEGRYRFTGVAAGAYAVGALAPGFVTPIENMFYQPGKSINVSEGENIEDLDFNLKRGGVITGRVSDSNGKPVIDENVALSGLDQNGRSINVNFGMNYFMYRTDDRGVYRLYGLAAGRYTVSVGEDRGEGSITSTMNRTVYQRTYHPDTTDRSKATVVVLGEGDEVTGVDVSLGEAKKTFDVYGRIVDADTGQPIVGVEISRGTYARGGEMIGPFNSMGERSNAKGEFQLQNILPGKYAAYASPNDRNEYYSDPTPFEILDSDITGVEIRARRGGSISGVMMIEGTNDPEIISRLSQQTLVVFTRDQSNMPGRGGIRINPAGGFQITGVRPGKTEISLSSGRGKSGFTLLRVERDGVPQREGIEMGPGEKLANVRVVVTYGTAKIRGELKITGAEVPEGSSFIIFAQRVGALRSGTLSAQTDMRGQFLLEGLSQGEYDLRVSYFNRRGGMDGQLMSKISRFKQTVNVGNTGEIPVILTIDLSKKENER